jgi:hypothetical protein
VIPRRLAAAGVLAVWLPGCAYYNGMWSAQRLARDAQRMEARGQEAEARLTWGRAAVKAESVLVHHGRSRWADAALVLQGEGLARSGNCAAAALPLTRALRGLVDDVLRERAALAAADCALREGETGAAEQLLVPLLSSPDTRRRSSAAYLAGRVALARGDPLTAADRFARSDRAEAASARIHALVAAGRANQAVNLIDSLARRDRDAARWSAALNDLGRVAGAVVASDGLDRLLLHGRLPDGARARLLLADGDRLRAARLLDRAAERYVRAAALVPDSVEAGRARVRTVALAASRASTAADLDSVSQELRRISAGLGGTAGAEARELALQIAAVGGGDSADAEAFRAAELARDSLLAPGLAAALFFRFAERYPSSLFAAKALIAAGQLRPELLDSVGVLLRARYPQSPYTRGFQGEASAAFQILEDSLATALGVTRAREQLLGRVSLRVAPPRPGPRGPALDPPADVAATVATRPGRPTGPLPQRPRRPADRPAQRPEDRP